MRVLFYIPVVTPWWFDHIVAPLIRVAAREAEVHVMVPPRWRGTGIVAEQLAPFSDLESIAWHILDGDDHPRLRTSALDQPEILDLVHAIGPDLTLCRSADIVTPRHFPGIVRSIMEGGAPPFATPGTAIVLADALFDHGVLPMLNPARRAALDAAFACIWDAERIAWSASPDRNAFLIRTQLPPDRRIVGLPLEYEHEEMFFASHQAFPDNLSLVEAMAAAIGDDAVLAVTNHPLNEAMGVDRRLRRLVDRLGARAKMLRPIGGEGGVTGLLARHADGLVVGNSKSFAVAAFHGTPMLRLSPFATGGWLGAQTDVQAFMTAIAAGSATRPAEADARTWFAWHLLDRMVDAADPALRLADLVGRATRLVDPARWESGIMRLARPDLGMAA